MTELAEHAGPVLVEPVDALEPAESSSHGVIKGVLVAAGVAAVVATVIVLVSRRRD